MAIQDEVKVYKPEVVEDSPFPMGYVDSSDDSVSQATSNGVYSPSTTKDSQMPEKKIAFELMSTAMNTRSKKILKEFQFTQSGAIQIGKYENGVSGDMRLSPDGIVARNKSGITTFAIDGDTGDAIFAGQLRTGSLITGDVFIQGGAIKISGQTNQTVLDEYGLVSTANFQNTTVSRGSGQDVTGTSYVDLTDSAFTITVTRATNFLFTLTIPAHLIETASDRGNAVIYCNVGGNIANYRYIYLATGNTVKATRSITFLETIPASEAGVEIKLQARFETVHAGTPILRMSEYWFTRVSLGS